MVHKILKCLNSDFKNQIRHNHTVSNYFVQTMRLFAMGSLWRSNVSRSGSLLLLYSFQHSLFTSQEDPQEDRAMSGIPYATVPQTLMEVKGLVVRQKTQKGEVVAQMLGIPFESKNKYKVGLLPPNKGVKNQPEDPDGWEPTAEELDQLDTFMFAREESGCMTRTCMMFLGCGNLRPLQMHIAVNGSTGDAYVIQRPFMIGACCCCPLEMNLDAIADGQAMRLGRVREDFSPYFGKCMSACCLATTYTDIERAMPDGTYEKKYSLRTNLSCCGRVNNCCGATCFKNDAVYDILDTKGEIVAHLQMTYARGKGMGACCRMGLSFNNYILEFPRDSTAEDRMLLLTAVFQVEYQLFETSGDK